MAGGYRSQYDEDIQDILPADFATHDVMYSDGSADYQEDALWSAERLAGLMTKKIVSDEDLAGVWSRATTAESMFGMSRQSTAEVEDTSRLVIAQTIFNGAGYPGISSTGKRAAYPPVAKVIRSNKSPIRNSSACEVRRLQETVRDRERDWWRTLSEDWFPVVSEESVELIVDEPEMPLEAKAPPLPFPTASISPDSCVDDDSGDDAYWGAVSWDPNERVYGGAGAGQTLHLVAMDPEESDVVLPCDRRVGSKDFPPDPRSTLDDIFLKPVRDVDSDAEDAISRRSPPAHTREKGTSAYTVCTLELAARRLQGMETCDSKAGTLQKKGYSMQSMETCDSDSSDSGDYWGGYG